MVWLNLMSEAKFYFDKEWWNTLSKEEQEECLDWAESCGANREVSLTDRNPDYPDLVCHPHVSLELSDEDMIEIFK